MFDKYLVPLYMLYCMHGELRGRTRFQKLVFLTKEKLKEENHDIDIQFSRLFYGPFSRDLRNSIKTQIKEGTLLECVEESSYGLVYVYTLTDEGRNLVADSLQKGLIDQEVKRHIEEVARGFGDKPLDELIAIVYRDYPQYDPHSTTT
jgi:uncharacterized protein YwgA